MTADRIALLGMEFHGRHGVLPEERERGQRFLLDLIIEADLADAARHDDLTRTVDYREAYAIARRVAEGPPMALLEAVAETVAAQVLALPRVLAVVVRVRKPDVVLGGPLEAAAVEIHRRRAPSAPQA